MTHFLSFKFAATLIIITIVLTSCFRWTPIPEPIDPMRYEIVNNTSYDLDIAATDMRGQLTLTNNRVAMGQKTAFYEFASIGSRSPKNSLKAFELSTNIEGEQIIVYSKLNEEDWVREAIADVNVYTLTLKDDDLRLP